MKFLRNPRTQGRLRFGMTMIDTLVMISLVSVMLVLTTGWIQRTMKQVSRFRQLRREQITLTRLAERFRMDMWSSNDATVVASNTIRLSGQEGKRKTYSFTDGRIEYSCVDSIGNLKAQEQFKIGPGRLVKWEETNPGVRMVVLGPETGAHDSHVAADETDLKIALIVTTNVGRWVVDSASLSEGTTE